MREVIVRSVNLTTTFRRDARSWRWVALGAVLLATGAIASTYHVFNNMYDEPAHLAAGMEWLSRGTYALEPQHPPLSRIASAVLPWLDGEQSKGSPLMYAEGRLILGQGEHYRRVLTLARLGQLPFFFLLAFTTWYWARRASDEQTAAVAVLFLAANPNVLAHAGVAGTDIGPAALMPAALLAWVLWLEHPSMKRSALLGVAVAVCGLTKFSALAFWLPAAVATALIAAFAQPAQYFGVAGVRRFGRPLAIAVSIAALVTWAVYRFSIGRAGALTLPAPAFWIGLRDFLRHGTGGHPGFLLGEVKLGGWWYYDAVAFLVKTPVPLLLFGAIGTWLVARSRDVALVMGVASVLIVASFTPVDIGVRLLLPAYAPLAVLAALGIGWAWQRSARLSNRLSNRLLVGALALWTVVEPLDAHPDHIAYFNVFAGPHPERVLVDSNLDWGQDLYRLRDVWRGLEGGGDSLRVHYFGTAELAAVGLNRTRRLRPHERTTGWVAASETFYAGVWSDTALHWLRAYDPVARVGRSIRLYFIPDPGALSPKIGAR